MGNIRKSPDGTGKNPAVKEPLEDRALKTAAHFMGKELLPLLGIEGTMKRTAPTEQVYLNLKELLEDFNYEMEDGTWKHLEFESDGITKDDLRRFRAYEAVISYHYRVEVTTYVLCSSNVRDLRHCLSEGMNTYQVQVIQMKKHNADEIICGLEEKQKRKHLERDELLKLLLTPLMDGKMEQLERIKRSLMLLKGERDVLEKAELMQMQAVLYTLAMKFLSVEELVNVKEVIKMTVLGEMIRQDGFEDGKEIGKEIGMELGIRALVESLVGFHIPKEEILSKLMEKFDLERERATELYKKYAEPQTEKNSEDM